MDRIAAENARQLALFDEFPVAQALPERHLMLAGKLVEFRFERRRRRTIGLQVDAAGLSVSAPQRTPWREIEAFLRASERWILAKLDEWTAAGRPRRLFVATGEVLPLFGQDATLRLREGRRAVTLQRPELVVQHPAPHRRGAVRELLLKWLRSRALEALAPRLAHYAARLDRPAPPVAVSNARTQWGVCTASGRIRLSWRLVHLEPALADYVVAHEAAHLVELNHSKRFWKLVEALYPDWRAARQAIEHADAALPII